MFAGPNGSGKSTLKSYLPERLLGYYLNPDEIEREIREVGHLDLARYGVRASALEVASFLQQSPQVIASGSAVGCELLGSQGDRLSFGRAAANSYWASAVAEFFRERLLAQRETFTFETVMSHRGKVEFLAEAQRRRYRTYLYFIATDDPQINISRVRSRVRLGGHSVPEDKIVSRYHSSLELLLEAIRHTHRAYIFDNSGENQESVWLAEITDGLDMELKSDHVPAWFKRSVLDKIARRL